MKIQILSVGNKPPAWVQEGYRAYSKRFADDWDLELIQIAAPKHHQDQRKYMAAEGDKILAKIRPADWVVALQEAGGMMSSRSLAEKVDAWQKQGVIVKFLIGGADGLAPNVLARSNEQMSLSKLTFPHYLVRVILAEALYRAWSITRGHPYHRD